MNKFLFTLLFCPILALGQLNYNISVYTNNSWNGNLFFQQGGSPPGWTSPPPPPRPVKIIDSSGVEIFSQNWGMKGWDFKVNYNNKLSYYDRISKGWFIMDSLQNEVDSVYARNGYTADNHDFLALPNGNYVLIAYDDQPYAMDTVVPGGDPNAVIEGLIIQELDSNHNVVFEWKSWDHFHITDNTYLSPWTGSNLAFIHANAIDIDFDGNFIISSRQLDEITKIHRTTGEVIWRFGGSQNDFILLNDYPFTHQHSIRSLGDNRYILFDNGNYSAQYTGGSNISRAVEYELDTNLMTATKVWEFIHPDSLYSPSISGVQRLPNGNTLIDFGNLQWLGLGSIVTEVDTNNQIVFQLEYDNGGNLYRAQKFDWFFYSPPTISWNCIGGSCIDPGTGLGSYTDSLQCVLNCVLPPINSWNCLVGSCIDPGTGLGSYTDSLQCLLNCSVTNINDFETLAKLKLVKIINVLGQEATNIKNTPLFYIFNDGTVEKRIIIE
jgi:hypothetical protein